MEEERQTAAPPFYEQIASCVFYEAYPFCRVDQLIILKKDLPLQDNIRMKREIDDCGMFVLEMGYERFSHYLQIWHPFVTDPLLTAQQVIMSPVDSSVAYLKGTEMSSQRLESLFDSALSEFNKASAAWEERIRNETLQQAFFAAQILSFALHYRFCNILTTTKEILLNYPQAPLHTALNLLVYQDVENNQITAFLNQMRGEITIQKQRLSRQKAR